MRKFKKDDLVLVIAGKDKGKSGKILSVKDDKCVVENINEYSKTQKPTQQNAKGGIIQVNLPIHISNVKLVVGKDSSRVGFDVKGDKKFRVLKKTGKAVD